MDQSLTVDGVRWKRISHDHQPEAWAVDGAPNDAFVNLPRDTPRPGIVQEREGHFTVIPVYRTGEPVPEYETREDALQAESAKERIRARASAEAVALFAEKATNRAYEYAEGMGA